MSQLAWKLDDTISGNYRASDPLSSVIAGRGCNAEAQRGRILEVMRHANRPMYAAEIAAKTDIPTAQVNSRLATMAHKCQVVRLDKPGENHRGQPVLLWELVL